MAKLSSLQLFLSERGGGGKRWRATVLAARPTLLREFKEAKTSNKNTLFSGTASPPGRCKRHQKMGATIKHIMKTSLKQPPMCFKENANRREFTWQQAALARQSPPLPHRRPRTRADRPSLLLAQRRGCKPPRHHHHPRIPTAMQPTRASARGARGPGTAPTPACLFRSRRFRYVERCRCPFQGEEAPARCSPARKSGSVPRLRARRRTRERAAAIYSRRRKRVNTVER